MIVDLPAGNFCGLTKIVRVGSGGSVSRAWGSGSQGEVVVVVSWEMCVVFILEVYAEFMVAHFPKTIIPQTWVRREKKKPLPRKRVARFGSRGSKQKGKTGTRKTEETIYSIYNSNHKCLILDLVAFAGLFRFTNT